MIEAADDNILKRDIRVLDGKDLIAELLNFTASATSFDANCNEAAEKSLITIFEKNVHKLKVCLNEEWNTSLSDNSWIFFKASTLRIKHEYTCDVCS